MCHTEWHIVVVGILLMKIFTTITKCINPKGFFIHWHKLLILYRFVLDSLYAKFHYKKCNHTYTLWNLKLLNFLSISIGTFLMSIFFRLNTVSSFIWWFPGQILAILLSFFPFYFYGSISNPLTKVIKSLCLSRIRRKNEDPVESSTILIAATILNVSSTLLQVLSLKEAKYLTLSCLSTMMMVGMGKPWTRGTPTAWINPMSSAPRLGQEMQGNVAKTLSPFPPWAPPSSPAAPWGCPWPHPPTCSQDLGTWRCC